MYASAWRAFQSWTRARGILALPASTSLTAEALAAVKATAKSRRSLGTDGRRQESAERAAWRGRVDVALLSILRDGLLRRSEAAALTWADVDLRDNGSALLQIHRSKTDPEGEGVVLYIGKEAGEALRTIRPAELLLDRNTPVFGLSPRQIGRRVQANEGSNGGDGDPFPPVPFPDIQLNPRAERRHEAPRQELCPAERNLRPIF